MLQENKIWGLEMVQRVKVQLRNLSGDLSLGPKTHTGWLTAV